MEREGEKERETEIPLHKLARMPKVEVQCAVVAHCELGPCMAMREQEADLSFTGQGRKQEAGN